MTETTIAPTTTIETGKVYQHDGQFVLVLGTNEDGSHNVLLLDGVHPMFGKAASDDLLPLDQEDAQPGDLVDKLIWYVAATRLRHEQDIAEIGRTLIGEAERRDWCSEYDSIVTDLNGRLVVPIEERKYEYDVEMSVTYRVNNRVTARDRRHAIRLAGENTQVAVDQVAAAATDLRPSVSVIEAYQV